MTDAERIHATIEAVAASGRPCLLCGGTAAAVACFVPSAPSYRAALGVTPGRERLLLYAICVRCAAAVQADPGRFEAAIVEAFAAAHAAVN